MKVQFFQKTICCFLAAGLAVSLAGCVLPSTPTAPTVVLSAEELALRPGESVLLTADVSDGSAVEWVSGAEEIATVENGLVTGISEGQTTIAAVAGDGYATCSVTVRSDDEGGLLLSMTSARLQIGDAFSLQASSKDAVWLSSSEEVATVENGLVTGISEGTALITAVSGAAKAECVVNVSHEETVTLTLSKFALSVREGEMYPLTAASSDPSPVTWWSEDPAVATVSGGTVSGMGIGSTVIYAWTAYASAACRVSVREVSDPYKEGYALVWNDEFSGDALDTEKWGYMTGVQDFYGSSAGPMFWGNNELQYYTEDAVTVEGGSLVITATREDMEYGRQYSSARIHTRDKGYWTYGYFEARMQTPAKTGMWPAFWMLPQPSSTQNSQNVYGGWPANGEIDIMEARGRLGNKIDTTAHFGAYGRQASSGTTSSIKGTTEDWHTYALEWTETYMTWHIDGYPVYTVTSDEWWSGSSDSATAPFDVDFYLLINLAVGGMYDQNHAPDADFVSAQMRVDYVRVYQEV